MSDVANQLRDAAAVLARLDTDWAREENGRGYSKSDGPFGHGLATLPLEAWTDAITYEAWTMLRRYKSQLLQNGIDFDQIPIPQEVESEAVTRDSGQYGHFTTTEGRAAVHEATEKARIEASKRITWDAERREIVVAFDYDAALVSLVKRIPGRQWHATTKTNRFPRSSAAHLVAFAEEHGFQVEQYVVEQAELNPLDAHTEPDLNVIMVGKEIHIRFDYDANLVHAVKQMVPGARWRSDQKVWVAPMSSSAQAIGFADYSKLTVSEPLRILAGCKTTEMLELKEESKALDAEIEIARLAPGMELLPFQRAGVRYALKTRRCFIADEMGLGKLAPLSEPILTPAGWVSMGEIEVGSRCIGRDGTATEVVGVYPQGTQPIVKITFNDGSWTRCSWDHLWSVQHARNGRRHPDEWETLTTRQIVDRGLVDGAGNRTWRIPMVEAVRYDEGPSLPVDPYLLGVILGDGHVTAAGGVVITTDEEILDGLSIWNRSPHHSEGIADGRVNSLRSQMTALGLAGHRSWEKFVPAPYLRGSPEQRLALLQGLMDTDGSPITAGGGTEFSSTAEALCDAVVELAESLGGVARKKGPRVTKYQGDQEGRPLWRVNVKLPATQEPFRLKRKLDKWIRPTKYGVGRIIASVEDDGVEEAQCIRVAAEDQLYVTRHFIVTHNTLQALAAVVTGDALPVVCAVPNLAKGNWPREIRKFFPDLSVEVVSGTRSQMLFRADITILNYDILCERVDDLIRLQPKAAIFDESHYIKNGSEKVTCPECGGDKGPNGKDKLKRNAKRCQCGAQFPEPLIKYTVKRTEGAMRLSRAIPPDGMVLLLTGTPVLNRPIELINQLQALGKLDDFGGAWHFKKRFCGAYRSDYGWDFSGNSNEIELHETLRSTCYVRRLKADVYPELPARRHVPVYQELSPAAMKEYRIVESDVVEALAKRARELMLESGADEDEAQAVYWQKKMRAQSAEHLVAIGVLMRTVAALRLQQGIEWVDEFLADTADDNGKILEFATNVDIVEGLAAHHGEMAVKIRGGVSQHERFREGGLVDQFQNDAVKRVFVGNFASAKEALTLTAASNVAFFQMEFTPASHDQAIDRCYGRVNDPHGAVGWYFIAPDTIDEDTWDILERKRVVIDAVTDGVEKESRSKESFVGDLIVKLTERGLEK